MTKTVLHNCSYISTFWLVLTHSLNLFLFHAQMNETFQQPGRWHDVILTPTPRASSEPLTHFMFYTLKGLQPSAVYEAIVQAKNRYGWNEVSFSLFLWCCVICQSFCAFQVSDIFQFYTQRSASDPRIEDMELVASSTSRNKSSQLAVPNVALLVLLSILNICYCYSISAACSTRRLLRNNRMHLVDT